MKGPTHVKNNAVLQMLQPAKPFKWSCGARGKALAEAPAKTLWPAKFLGPKKKHQQQTSRQLSMSSGPSRYANISATFGWVNSNAWDKPGSVSPFHRRQKDQNSPKPANNCCKDELFHGLGSPQMLPEVGHRQCQQCNPRRLENRLPSNLPVCQIERDTAKEKDVRRIFLGQKHLCIAISSYHSHRVINPPRGLGASNKSNTMAKEASAGQTLRPPKLLGFTGTTAGESSGETMENRRLRRPHQQDPTFQCFGSGARTVEGKTSGLKSWRIPRCLGRHWHHWCVLRILKNHGNQMKSAWRGQLLSMCSCRMTDFERSPPNCGKIVGLVSGLSQKFVPKCTIGLTNMVGPPGWLSTGGLTFRLAVPLLFSSAAFWSSFKCLQAQPQQTHGSNHPQSWQCSKTTYWQLKVLSKLKSIESKFKSIEICWNQ